MLRQMLLAAVLMLSTAGCRGPNTDSVSVPTGPIVENVKTTLEAYAKTGRTGSSLTALNSDINGIASSNSALAENLRTKYRELQAAKNPAVVKATAKEMLEILQGG